MVIAFITNICNSVYYGNKHIKVNMGFTWLLCHLASDTQAWLLLCHLASDIQASNMATRISNFAFKWDKFQDGQNLRGPMATSEDQRRPPRTKRRPPGTKCTSKFWESKREDTAKNVRILLKTWGYRPKLREQETSETATSEDQTATTSTKVWISLKCWYRLSG